MRLRNIPNALETIKESKYFIKNNETISSKKIFNNSNELYVEIGCGKGDFIVNSAIKNPDKNYIAIEKYASVLLKAVEKANKLELDNLYFMSMDATLIDSIFKNEIDGLYLNFSDPWPKKRHVERRLTSDTFLDKYENIFKNEKIIQMKTDNRKLFEFSLIKFVEHNYKIENISLDLYHDDIKDNVPTEYERKFANKGNNIYQVNVKKY